jgi:hypothetical protein
MARAVELPCSLKVLRFIEQEEKLHSGSLAEQGMVHGTLGLAAAEEGKVKIMVIDDGGEIVYHVGSRTQTDWVDYFRMTFPHGERLINPADFRGAINALKEL